MPDAQVVKSIRDKYLAIVSDLDERSRRRWAAAEARSLGRGGVTAVAKATGISVRTIRFVISSTKVGALLKAQGYSLQANRKTVEGKQHPDRNAQFEHIARRVNARRRAGDFHRHEEERNPGKPEKLGKNVSSERPADQSQDT